MHANFWFFTVINNLGTKGQSIRVTCRAVALRGGGFTLFAGCFVPQNSSPHPKTRHFCPTFYLYKTVSAKGAVSYEPGATPQGKSFPPTASAESANQRRRWLQSQT